MAIRAALGASVRRNLATVIVDAGRPLGAGLVVGLAAAVAAAPVLRSLLFGVEPLSAGPLVAVTWTLLVAGLVSALAAALPIRRVDPIDALKGD